MAKRAQPSDEFDSPWKEALDSFFEAFLAFLHRGPLGAHVDAVESEWLAAQGGAPYPFEVRRTT